MKQTYQQIPEEKREKILQAAIAEFAKHGYDKASNQQDYPGGFYFQGALVSLLWKQETSFLGYI